MKSSTRLPKDQQSVATVNKLHNTATFTSIEDATEGEIQNALSQYKVRGELYSRMIAVEIGKGLALEGADVERIKTKIAAWNARHKNDGKHFVCGRSATTGRILVLSDK